MSDNLQVANSVRESFAPILQAVLDVREALSAEKDVVTVRPGYRYPETGEPEPAVVVAVTPGTTPVSAADLSAQFRVPVTIIDATVEEQLEAEDAAISFAPGERTASASRPADLRDVCFLPRLCFSRSARSITCAERGAVPSSLPGAVISFVSPCLIFSLIRAIRSS